MSFESEHLLVAGDSGKERRAVRSESGHEVDCQSVQDLADDYVMAGLDPDVHDAITAHCQECPHCRESIDDLIDLSAVW